MLGSWGDELKRKHTHAECRISIFKIVCFIVGNLRFKFEGFLENPGRSADTSMARAHLFSMGLLLLLSMLFHWTTLPGAAQTSGLQGNFYQKTCTNVEDIVKKEMTAIYYIHGNAAVSFLRAMFHDCAVQGCDASLLLDSTPSDSAEKESFKNFGMRNYKYLDRIKSAVEAECPNTVSCADILILAGREGISLLGGPYISVTTGRRDSLYGSKAKADAQLFVTDLDITNLLARFSAMNLNTAHTVALLGAHTVGRTHCVNVVSRLYPTVDQTLDANYAQYLKMRCPTPTPNPEAVAYARNDRTTPMRIDNQYYKNLIANKGILKVDQALYLDPRTKDYVVNYANDEKYFFDQFTEAISILTQYKPLTGAEGEIRKQCRFVN